MGWLSAAQAQLSGSGTLEEAMLHAAVNAWMEHTSNPPEEPSVWIALVPHEADLEQLKEGRATPTELITTAVNTTQPELRAFLDATDTSHNDATELLLIGCCQDTGLRSRVTVPLAPQLMFDSHDQALAMHAAYQEM